MYPHCLLNKKLLVLTFPKYYDCILFFEVGSIVRRLSLEPVAAWYILPFHNFGVLLKRRPAQNHQIQNGEHIGWLQSRADA